MMDSKDQRAQKEHKDRKDGDKASRRLTFVKLLEKLLGAKEVEVLQPTESESVEDGGRLVTETSFNITTPPICATQSVTPGNVSDSNLPTKSDDLGVIVGLLGSIPRWHKGSVINFAAYARGYPTDADAVYAAQQLNRAALYWNRINVGVTFRWVGKLEDAAFVLSYGGNQGGLVARAFFPNDRDLNDLIVYKRAFDPDLKANMWRYFLHELGHVLGLRHEFAPEREQNSGATKFGPRDPLSVMEYRPEPPMITALDAESTKAFYAIPAGPGPSYIGNTPLAVFHPDN